MRARRRGGAGRTRVGRPRGGQRRGAPGRRGVGRYSATTPFRRDPERTCPYGTEEERHPPMVERRPTMMDPPLESLLDRVDSKFTLVTLAAMRGRQINSYFNQLGEGLGTIVPPQVTSVSRKPLSISLEEISAAKITYHRRRPTRSWRRGARGRPNSPARAAPGRAADRARGLRGHRRLQGRRGVPSSGGRRRPREPGADPGATRFVGELTFSALGSERAQSSLWDGPAPIPHTRLGQGADLIMVVPATARLLGAYAAGISSDLLTATLLATRAPVLVCPAMHTEMWEHPAVAENMATLRRRGVHVVGTGDRSSGRRRRGAGAAGRPGRHRGRRLRGPGRGVGAGRSPGPGHRGRHPRADRRGALHRQPLVGQAGPRGGGAAGAARRHRAWWSPPPTAPFPPAWRSSGWRPRRRWRRW